MTIICRIKKVNSIRIKRSTITHPLYPFPHSWSREPFSFTVYAAFTCYQKYHKNEFPIQKSNMNDLSSRIYNWETQGHFDMGVSAWAGHKLSCSPVKIYSFSPHHLHYFLLLLQSCIYTYINNKTLKFENCQQAEYQGRAMNVSMVSTLHFIQTLFDIDSISFLRQ